MLRKYRWSKTLHLVLWSHLRRLDHHILPLIQMTPKCLLWKLYEGCWLALWLISPWHLGKLIFARSCCTGTRFPTAVPGTKDNSTLVDDGWNLVEEVYISLALTCTMTSPSTSKVFFLVCVLRINYKLVTKVCPFTLLSLICNFLLTLCEMYW